MTEFNFTVNAKEIADKLGEVTDDIGHRINDEVKRLSISTHAFVVAKANEELKGWRRQHFFGEENKNVRWNEVAPNIWVVEIDESVAWIEEGRDPVSMATENWLLKPGSKGLKTAKDGSTYKVIPFKQATSKGGRVSFKDPDMASMIRKTMRSKGIKLNKIERDQWGQPKLGVVEKLGNKTKRKSYPEKFFSEPRSKATAKQIGLKSHHGHHFMDSAVVVQREVEGPSGKKRISRDVVTFRVVSSKHKAEGRWMYPRVEPLNSIPEAYKYAEAEWETIVKSLEEEFNNNSAGD